MPRPTIHEEADPRPPSRSQKKRESHAAQDLGCRLTQLPESALSRLDLPPRLSGAIADLRRMTKHEARRRQLQFIGALMREVDAEPISRAIADIEAGNRVEAHDFHLVETWRDTLVAGDESKLEDILALAPEEERPELRSRIRQLARNARAEAERNKPQRAGRNLFRLLRALRRGEAAAPDNAAEGSED